MNLNDNHWDHRSGLAYLTRQLRRRVYQGRLTKRVGIHGMAMKLGLCDAFIAVAAALLIPRGDGPAPGRPGAGHAVRTDRGYGPV
jgi:hypothetical protein